MTPASSSTVPASMMERPFKEERSRPRSLFTKVRHLEVVALTPARLLLVVITDSGRVDQRIVELGDAIDEHELSKLREMLGQALEGKPLTAASIARQNPH